MAILPFTPGISASILLSNLPAPELPDPDPRPAIHTNPIIASHQSMRTVSSYIEARSRQSFAIKLSVGPPYVSGPPWTMQPSKLRFEVFVDGKEAWIAHCERPRLKEMAGGVWEFVVTGIKVGKGRGCQERGFRFADVGTNNDWLGQDKMKEGADRMMKVGLIEIRVFRGNYGKPGGPTKASFKGFVPPDGVEVPEATLKGKVTSHAATLGKAKSVARGPVWRSDKLDGGDMPMVIFKFMYRSIESLKQLGIISRSASPSPAPSLTPSLDEEETRAVLEAAKQKKKAAAVKVKRERDDERMGSVVSARPAKKRKKAGKPVLIDLCSDAEEDGENFSV